MYTAKPAARRGTYVVTYDVASRTQSFRPGLTVPRRGDSMFKRFHRRLYKLMEQSLPGVAIEAITMDQLRAEIWRRVETRVTNLHSQAVLSTCLEIADSHPKSEGLLLNINRLFDTSGKMIGHGPRPGFDPLDKQ